MRGSSNFERAIVDYWDDLLPLATALTGTPCAAADLVGAATARAGRRWRRLSRLEFPAEELQKLLVLTYLAAGSRPGAYSTAPDSAGTQDLAGPQAERDGDPVIDGGLDLLPARQRAVLVLNQLMLLSETHIASMLDWSVAGVARDLAQARETLRNAQPGIELDELRSALRRLSDRTPAVDAVRRSLAHHSQRLRSRRTRRVAIGVATVACLSAVALVPTVLVPRLPVFIRQSGEWTFMHTVDPPEGWRALARSVTADREITELTNDAGQNARTCVVSVSLPATDTFTSPNADIAENAVTVRGRSGFFSDSKVERVGGGPYVAWRYADDGWAWVHCAWLGTSVTPDPTRAELTALARSVEFDRSPITLPFSFGPPPEPFAVEALTEHADGRVEIKLAARPGATSGVALSFSIPAEPGRTQLTNPVRLSVGGRTAVLSGKLDQPTLCFQVQGQRACLLASLSSDRAATGALPESVLTTLTETAEVISFAPDITDRGTWSSADRSLPR